MVYACWYTLLCNKVNISIFGHVVKHGLDWTRKTWTGLGKHGLSPGFIKPGLSPCFTKPVLSPFLYQNIVLNVYFNVLYQARQSILQM